MAKDENKLNVSSINKTALNIQDGMEKLYRQTYFAPRNNKKSLEQIKSSIDSSIDNLISNNMEKTGQSSLSTLYKRIEDKNLQAHSSAIKELEDIFNDPTLTEMLMTTWSSNRYIKEYDNDLDILCKYMPQLRTALDIKKDSVISTDHFGEDFLNAVSDKKDNLNEFVSRMKLLKQKYDLLNKVEKWYDDAQLYGEEFVYVVPYKQALNKLINSDARFRNITESSDLNSSSLFSVLYESVNDKALAEELIKDTKKDVNIPNITVEINKSNVLPFAVQELKQAIRLKKSSLLEATDMFDQTIPDDTKLKGLKDNEVGIDGLVNSVKDLNDFDIPGAIVHKLKRELVKPVYIEDMCMGYYYLEWLGHGDPFEDTQSSTYDPMFMNKSFANATTSKEANTIFHDEDYVLKRLAERISGMIDKNFIENNQDLRKEIYMLLKYNDAVKSGDKAAFRITFIPPDDIEHIYFRMNEKTHRGISDLDGAILPSTLYTGLYMTNTLGILTRGFDKRVYYVKQSVDTNISKTLINTINQIKKANFGSREMTSIKHILNITGRYNDMIVPTNSSGETPVTMEVTPGQNIDIKTELMEQYERMAINSTEVPYEMVQIRENSVDYAMQLTMTNAKFIRIVYKRQALYNANLSRIITKLYNYEFNTHDTITIKLPSPTFLNLTQTSNMLDNNEAFCTKIMELHAPMESDEFKLMFKKNLSKKTLATYVDYAMVEDVMDQTRLELEKITSQSNDAQQEE